MSEIRPDDWIVANAPAETGELQYVVVESGIGQRIAHYGPIGDRSNLDIAIDTSSTSVSGTLVDVKGVEWSETDEPGFWSAERRIGDAAIRVSSSTLDAELGRQILLGLTLVPTLELPIEPIDVGVLVDARTAPVATYSTEDRTFTMRAAQQNGYYCTFTDDGTGGGGSSCGEFFDPTTSWASPGTQGYGHDEDTNEVTVEASGIVAPDVVVVEIDFINDTTVTLSPTDLTGTFASQFWTAGATIELDPGQDPYSILSAVIEIRSLDDVGSVLYTQTPASGTANR